MRRVITAVAMLIVGVALPCHAEETLLARATNDVDGRTFQLSIVEIKHNSAQSQTGPKFDIVREVRIRCIKGCNRDISFREQQFDAPLGGAFVLRDDSPEFVTTWGGGSAYRVRIYRVEGNHISKVFEQGSKSFPQFVMDHDGAFLIVLNNPDSPAAVQKIALHGTFWRNGLHGYAPVGSGHE